MRWLALFAVAFCITFVVRVSQPVERIATATNARTQRDGVAAVKGEAHATITVVSLIVSPGCAACNDPSLVTAINNTRESFNDSIRAQPVLVGAALAESASSGLEFLDRFGPLNEVVSGTGWEGIAGLRYLRGIGNGVEAVPQLMVSEIMEAPGSMAGDRRVIERLVQRRVGLDAILHFSRSCALGHCIQR